MEFKPVYIKRWWEGVGWVAARLKQRNKNAQIVEFSVAIYDIHMNPQWANIPLQGL